MGIQLTECDECGGPCERCAGCKGTGMRTYVLYGIRRSRLCASPGCLGGQKCADKKCEARKRR